jgi:hypothetical protein
VANDNCVEVAFVRRARAGQWRKSSRSGTHDDNCVEVAHAGTVVAVRDSKQPDPVLTFPSAAWQAFLRTRRAG